MIHGMTVLLSYIEREKMEYMDIRFPHLGIVFPHVGRSIQIGSFEIMYYGVAIAIAFLAGYLLVSRFAKYLGQDPEMYLDFLLWIMVPVIIGARIYYVVFSWDYYKDHLGEIVNLRQGGLGIIGGITVGILVAILFCRKRKQSILLMLDTLTVGMLLGQIIGRWGNFFNREAFGCFTDHILAMQIPVEYFKQVGRLGEVSATGLLDQTVTLEIGGKAIEYIQVHPTFLYEGLWNLCILCLIFFWSKKKSFDGELFCIYLIGYGTGRFFIESLRVDQLQIGSTGIAATQVVCVLAAMTGLFWIICGKRKALKAQKGA